jgi:hypothetical protein
MVKVFGRLRRPDFLQGSNISLAEALKPQHLPVTPLEPMIFFNGDHDGALSAVTGNGYRLLQGHNPDTGQCCVETLPLKP